LNTNGSTKIQEELHLENNFGQYKLGFEMESVIIVISINEYDHTVLVEYYKMELNLH